MESEPCALRQYPSAVKEIQEAMRLQPNDADLVYSLSLTYVAAGDKTAAQQIQQKLQNMNPALAAKLSVDLQKK